MCVYIFIFIQIIIKEKKAKSKVTKQGAAEHRNEALRINISNKSKQ